MFDLHFNRITVVTFKRKGWYRGDWLEAFMVPQIRHGGGWDLSGSSECDKK